MRPLLFCHIGNNRLGGMLPLSVAAIVAVAGFLFLKETKDVVLSTWALALVQTPKNAPSGARFSRQGFLPCHLMTNPI